MSPTLLCLVMAPVLTLPLDADRGVELRYRGTLAYAGRGDSETPEKKFTTYCLVTAAKAGEHHVALLVDEDGGGSWPWPEQFGVIALDGKNAPAGKHRPRLLQTHDGTPHPVELRLPVFEHADRLKDGATWDAGELSYEVLGRGTLGERSCWNVAVSSRFGRTQSLWIDAESPVVLKLEQRVFLGQGDRFELQMELDSVKPLEKEQLPRLKRVVATLAQLKTDLKRGENETKPELGDRQLEAANSVLARLETEAESTPFSRFASVISRDVKQQLRRSGDVADLARKLVGEAAPKFDLKSLDGKTVDSGDFAGKTVLLHFWEYQGEPLTEPYGQVGYLDFLNGRRRKLGVQVYGVAVDPRVSDDSRSAAALQSIRKLKAFMNLSYPIAVDDGTLLRKFGDPRRLGAKLPLWVLIGPDGKVRHYKSGYYPIKPDEGLRELDEEVVRLIREQRRGNDE